MRTVITAITLFTAIAHAEWVNLSEQDFAATWKPVSGEWHVDNGTITGTSTDGKPAILVSTQEYRDFELDVDLVKQAGGMIVVRAHQLPDAPKKEGDLGLYGYLAGGTIPAIASEEHGGLVRLHWAEGPSSSNVDTIHIVARGNEVQAAPKPLPGASGASAQADTSAKFIGGKIALVTNGHTSTFGNIRIDDLGRDGEWRPLFNGTDFAGWKIWGTEEWKVEDGIIIGRSGPKKSEGYLATEETFKDFRVRGTFKMLGEGNFGLFYHSTIAYNDEQYPIISGLQGEVAPGYPSPSGWVYESYKRGWLVEPDMTTYRAFALRPNEWSEIEIESQGNHITTWVNGIQVLDLVDDKQLLTEGSFALQLHTGGTDGIQWKDLYVKK